jgi:PAS domain S-box-containing protein/putative nucleotidyltransferase with HDIG domain
MEGPSWSAPASRLKGWVARLGVSAMRTLVDGQRWHAASGMETSADQFRDLFENAGDVIYTTDLAGAITAINRAGERLTGYTQREMVGCPIARLVAPEHLGLLMRMTDPEVTAGPAIFEVEIVTKDGRRIPFEVCARPIARDGRPVGVQGIARDITWRRHVDEEIRKRAAHIEALNEIIAAADAAPDLPRLLDTAIDRTLAALGLTTGGIWVGDHRAVRGLGKAGDAIMSAAQNAEATVPSAPSREDGRGAIEEAMHPLVARWERSGARASLVVRILAEGRCIGGLAVASRRPRRWTPEEAALLESVAKQVGATAEALNLYHETRNRSELMGRLLGLSQSLNRPASVESAVAHIGHAAQSLSGAQRAAVFFRRSDGTITCPWSRGLSPEYVTHVVTPEIVRHWLRFTERAEPVRVTLAGGPTVEVAGPTLIRDTTELPRDSIVSRLAEREGYRALAVWPLTYEGRVIASISCFYNASHTWSAPEREAMQTFAWQAAAALENARLYEAQARRTVELEALYELSSYLRAAPTPEEMYPILVEHAMRLLHADHGALALLNVDGQTFTRVYTAGAPPEMGGSTFRVSGSLSGWVLQTGAPYVTQDFSCESVPGQRSAPQGTERALGPLVAVALRSEREAIGTLVMGRTGGTEKTPFTETEVRLLQGIAEMGGTAIRRGTLHENLEKSYIQMVVALARAVDARDAYTWDHSERLAAWADTVARALRCPENEIQDIRWGALLHDIGKIGIPDSILRKAAPLTDDEWVSMREHPLIGETILLPVERMREVARIVRHHQERWDGSGYPDHLQGDGIPLGARILAVVDAYSVITDDRPYKTARSHDEAVAELRRCADRQFDPGIVEVVCRVLDPVRDRPPASREPASPPVLELLGSRAQAEPLEDPVSEERQRSYREQ